MAKHFKRPFKPSVADLAAMGVIANIPHVKQLDRFQERVSEAKMGLRRAVENAGLEPDDEQFGSLVAEVQKRTEASVFDFPTMLRRTAQMFRQTDPFVIEWATRWRSDGV